MRAAALFLILGLLAAPAGPVLAVDPQEQLKDAGLEARARDISAGLRCLVCQNQSIDNSDAPLARDLRHIVRDRLQKGETNQQVVDYLVARYGKFVLLKPPLTLDTALLWLAPLLLIAGGGALALRVLRRPRQTPAPQPLTGDEEAELEDLLSREKPEAR